MLPLKFAAHSLSAQCQTVCSRVTQIICSSCSSPAESRASVSRQVVLRGVRGKRVGVFVVRVLAAVVGRGFPGEGDAGVVVRVDGLAEVDGVFQLLLQHLFARVPGQLEQEETRVGLWQEVVRRDVFIQHLDTNRKETRNSTRENAVNAKKKNLNQL